MKRFLTSLSMVALLAACSPAAPTENTEPIKLGFIGPLTGDAAAYGIDALNGVRLKVDEINAAGGINGRTIEVVAEDGRCAGTDGASAAQKLVNVDKVVAMVGPVCSNELLTAAPIVEEKGIVLISPTASSPDVTAAGDFIFRDYPSDALKTKAMSAYFSKQGFTKVAIISENTDFCTGFRDSLVKDVGEDHFVFNEAVEPGTKDFRTLITRLKESDVDVFVANGNSPSVIAAMITQLREQGIDALVITHDAGQGPETIELGGEAVEGLLAINVAAMGDETDFGKRFIAGYESAQASLAFAGHAYDAAGVLADAFTAVGTDGAAVRDYLYQLPSYEGVVGTFHFDENGDVEGIPYRLLEVKDGAWVDIGAISAK